MVDNRGPFRDSDLSGRRLGDRVGRILSDLDEAMRVEFIAVDGDDLGSLAGRCSGHEQRCLGKTVGRLDGPGVKAERLERLVESAHGRRGDRLAAIEDRLDIGQIQRRFTIAGQTPCRGVVEREVRGD